MNTLLQIVTNPFLTKAEMSREIEWLLESTTDLSTRIMCMRKLRELQPQNKTAA